MNAPILRSWAALLAAAWLAGCSGGSGSSDGVTPAAGTPRISGSVAVGGEDGRKGALAGATVCLDVDGDGACGAHEPQATTAADGGFAIARPAAGAGAALLVAEVPAGARADGQPLAQGFTLRAPAGHTVLSPLSSLVVAEAAISGQPADHVAARLRERAALEGAASLLADPGLDPMLSRLAALVRFTGAAQVAALQGEGLAAADIERESAAVLALALPELAAVARDGTAVLADAAQALARRLGPDAAWVRDAGRAFALAEPPTTDPPQPSGQVLALSYTDANNWLVRSQQLSAADSVADASGNLRFADAYARSASPAAGIPAGVVQRWTGHPSQNRANDTHWNGSAWVTCGGITARSTATPRDAQGRGSYDFCDGYEVGRTIRLSEDISGQDMAAVIRDKIRTFPGGSSGVSFANWGPPDLSVLAGRRFPPGSYLFSQSNFVVSTAPAYWPDDVRVRLYPVGVAAGGDTRATPTLDCNNPVLFADSALTAATTLEEMVARSGGRPCTYARAGTLPDVSLDPNEWWGNSTVGLGTLVNFNTRPAGTGAYYNTNANLRVAFTPGGRARFLRCLVRASDGSARNCTLLGIGTWRIDTFGDARVLSFSTLPAVVQRLNFTRVFVERGGEIYFGWRNPSGLSNPGVRLNLTAGNAVFDVLGLPRIQPITQPGTATGERAARLDALRGAWGTADDTTATVLRFGPDGRFMLAEAKPPASLTREQAGGELGWIDIDPATGLGSALIEVDSNLTSGLSHPRDDDRPFVVTADTLGDGATFTIPRLRDDHAATPTSLVGLWALDSASDLGAAHLALFGNGRAMFVTHRVQTGCTAPGECPPGVEYVQYSFDAATGELRFFGPLYDTNGCSGLLDSCPAAVAAGTSTTELRLAITRAADGRSFGFIDDTGQPRTFFRIPPRP